MQLCRRPQMFWIRPEFLAIYAEEPSDGTVPLEVMIEVGR